MDPFDDCPPPADWPCALLTVDAGGRVRRANADLGALLGRPPATVLGAPLESLLAPAAAVLYQGYVLPLLYLQGRVEEFELTLRGAEGARPQVLVYAARRKEDLRWTDIALVPVRQRRRVDEEVLRLRRAADMAPGMVFQLVRAAGGELHFPYVSAGVRSLFGVSAELAATSAAPLLAHYRSADRERLLRRLAEAGEGADGSPWSETLALESGPGAAPRWHELHASGRRLAEGATVWHGFVADATAAQLLAAERAERENAQQQSMARAEMVARISHEFRTPLNAIIGFSQLLAHSSRGQLGSAQQSQLQTIAAAGTSLLHLVNDVLDLSALQSDRAGIACAPVPLAPLLAQAQALVAPQAAEQGVALLPLRCDPPLHALADAQRLGQVLGNLLSNAVKYNRPGGSVGLAAVAEGPAVQITVVDTGPGFTAEQQRQLYQPFNRLGAERSGRQGTGLGLVITQQLVLLMGGTLALDSVPGQGSRFTVRLPAAAMADAAASADATPGGVAAEALANTPAEGPGFDVLYVEDDEVNALLMQGIVALRPGVTLRVATHGAQALAMVRERAPDLLLVDLNLPDTDGYALARRLRAEPGLAQVPAVLVSAAAGADQADAARRHGLQDCWSKPLDLQHTLAALRQWQQRRGWPATS